MHTFALITEGITDQAALESILSGLYDDEPDFRQIQPPRDATDQSRQGDFAGWEAVLEYCGLEEFANIFSTNDYVVIQIDTDIHAHPKLGIPITNSQGDRPDIDIVNDFRTAIISRIDPITFRANKDRIFFAICVHSLECWVLPLHVKDNLRAYRTKNCEEHLGRILNKANLTFTKEYRAYQSITKGFEKSKALVRAADLNSSLKIFITSLPPA
jgi:hypothetical protein